MVTRRSPSLDSLIGWAADRFVALCSPPPQGDEQIPSPVIEGGDCSEWARLAGMTGELPHPSIRATFGTALDLGLHDPDTVAHATLQQLCGRGLVDRIGGLPFRYRPRPNAVDRQPSRRRRRRA